MNTRNYASWLTLLTALFAFRVFAQLATLQFSIPYLPNFEAWHSGTMPYGLLVFFQLLILGLMIRITYRTWHNHLLGTVRMGRFLWQFGLVYVALVVTRLVLGQTLLEDVRFFANTITTAFHFVLASFVLITAHIIKRKNSGVCHV